MIIVAKHVKKYNVSVLFSTSTSTSLSYFCLRFGLLVPTCTTDEKNILCAISTQISIAWKKKYVSIFNMRSTHLRNRFLHHRFTDRKCPAAVADGFPRDGRAGMDGYVRLFSDRIVDSSSGKTGKSGGKIEKERRLPLKKKIILLFRKFALGV